MKEEISRKLRNQNSMMTCEPSVKPFVNVWLCMSTRCVCFNIAVVHLYDSNILELSDYSFGYF